MLDGPAAGDFCEFPVVDPRLAGAAPSLRLRGWFKTAGQRREPLGGLTAEWRDHRERPRRRRRRGARRLPRPGVPDDYVVMVVVHDAAGGAHLIAASPALESSRATLPRGRGAVRISKPVGFPG